MECEIYQQNTPHINDDNPKNIAFIFFSIENRKAKTTDDRANIIGNMRKKRYDHI